MLLEGSGLFWRRGSVGRVPELEELSLHSWEVAEIQKAITRILRMRRGVAAHEGAIDIELLSAVFAAEWPYDFDQLYPGYREIVFRAEVLRHLGFEVDDTGRVSIVGGRPS